MGIYMAEARIDLGQLRTNIEIVHRRLKDVKLLFPVKADGYGHGAVRIAQLAQEAGVDYLGVANLFEALELRQGGIRLPILILSASRPDLAEKLVEADVTVSVSISEMARSLEQAAAKAGKTVKVHIKVDTGMGRNGVLAEEADELVIEIYRECLHLEIEGIFSHFSVSYSEEPEDKEYTRGQIREFNRVLEALEAAGKLPPLCHIANSSGLIQYEEEVTSGYYNMVRPGVLLYGYPEVRRPWTEKIRPIMTLTTWVVSLKKMPPGRYIGYGRQYRTDSERLIATLPVGYADGVHPFLANRGEVLIRGRRAPIVGGISMDQLTVDVTHIPGVQVGDEVELISPKLPAEEIAQKIGARFTEVVLTALSRRVARVYIPA
jgi:alanine racemase